MVPLEAFLSEKPVLTTTDAGGPLEVVVGRAHRASWSRPTPRRSHARSAGSATTATRPPRSAAPGSAIATRGHLGPRDREAARVKLAYFSPMPPEQIGHRRLQRAAPSGARASGSTSPSCGAGRKTRAARHRRRALPRREQPGRARLDRRRAAQAAGRRRAPRLRPPPPRRRDDRRPARRPRLPRPDGARARRRRPAARARRPRQADPAALGVAAGGLPARHVRARARDGAHRPLAATSATTRARPASTGRSAVVPHPAWPAPDRRARARGSTGTVVGCFGVVNASKRIPELLRATAAVRQEHPGRSRSSSSGPTSPGFDLDRRLQRLGLDDDGLVREGWVDETRLWALMAGSDVLVNLRHPTMGETSGSVVRGLSLGKPLVVSDVGWFSELPDDVALEGPARRRRGGDADGRARAARGAARRSRRRWGASAAALARREHDVERVAELYVAALEKLPAAPPSTTPCCRRSARRRRTSGSRRRRPRRGRSPAASPRSSLGRALARVPTWAWLTAIVVGSAVGPRRGSAARPRRAVHHGRRDHLVGDRPRHRRRGRAAAARPARSRLQRRLPAADQPGVRALRAPCRPRTRR